LSDVKNTLFLGAGLAQLLAMELELGQSRRELPPDLKIWTLCYGPPPVYTSNLNIPVLSNMFLIQNNNDVIPSTSIRTIKDVLFKMSALDKLNYKRRELLKILLSDSNLVEYDESVENDILKKVRDVVENLKDSRDPYLHHVGQTLIVFTKEDEHSDAEVKIYTGLNETKHFSQEIIFRPSMVLDHISSGYDYIFNSIGPLSSELSVKLTALEDFHVRKSEKVAQE